MKLLVLTTQDRFFLSHILERALYIKDKGWEVIVATEKTSDDYFRRIQQFGFRVYDTQIRRKSVNPFSQLRDIITLSKIYKREKPDVCWHLGAKYIFWGTVTTRLFVPYSKIINSPIGLGFIYVSKSFKARLLRPLVTLLYRLLLNPKNSFVIVENRDDIEFFIKINAVNKSLVVLIPGAGINTEIFTPSQTKEKVCQVVMLSRLIREKGVHEYIQAAKTLHEERVAVQMVLVGEPDYGSPSSLTEREYKMLQHSDFIRCLGYQKDVLGILQKSHVCCLPSYREGLPRALIEAASCGLPVITTDTVGCRDIVLNGNGLLIKVGDIESLCQAVKFMVKNPAVREKMGANGRRLALSRFDSKLICDQTFKVLEDLVSRNK